jgi:hypothetical protein
MWRQKANVVGKPIEKVKNQGTVMTTVMGICGYVFIAVKCAQSSSNQVQIWSRSRMRPSTRGSIEDSAMIPVGAQRSHSANVQFARDIVTGNIHDNPDH